VFVWEKSSLDQGGKLHQDYLKNCRALLVEGKLTNIGDNEAVMYMNLLWDGMMKDKCYVRWLTCFEMLQYIPGHAGQVHE
jgi:hypothetical protein